MSLATSNSRNNGDGTRSRPPARIRTESEISTDGSPTASTPQVSPRAIHSLPADLQVAKGPGGSSHSYTPGEKSGFCRYINQSLEGDAVVAHLLPLDPTSEDLFAKNADGLLLCKLINMIQPDAVDFANVNIKTTLNIFQKTENINTAISAAKKLGISVVNIGAQDIIEGRCVSCHSLNTA
jgi:hypothetical protein